MKLRLVVGKDIQQADECPMNAPHKDEQDEVPPWTLELPRGGLTGLTPRDAGNAWFLREPILRIGMF